MVICRTLLDLDGRLNEVGRECEFLDSYIGCYNVSEDGMFSGEFIRAEDKRKRDEKRQYSTVNISLNPFVRKKCQEKLWEIKQHVISALIKFLEAKFSDFNNEIYEKM